jgi:hypothetical protein
MIYLSTNFTYLSPTDHYLSSSNRKPDVNIHKIYYDTKFHDLNIKRRWRRSHLSSLHDRHVTLLITNIQR